MKVSKADLNSITLYMEEEMVTIPCCTLESHASMAKPRNVANTDMVTARHAIAAKLRNVTSTMMVTPTPMINLLSASTDVKVINAPDIKVTNNPEIKAVNSSLINQTPPESPTYEVAPVKQQDTLHNFFHYINQGTFGIPYGGKIYCSSPGMDPVAWA